MNEEYDMPDESAYALVERYEKMRRRGESWFFDIDQVGAISEVYFMRGKIAKALSAANFGLGLFPTAISLQLRRAQLFASMNKLKKAMFELRLILDVEPYNEEAHLSIASVYGQMNDVKKAVEHYRKSSEETSEGDPDDVLFELACALGDQFRYSEAIRVLKRALNINPENDLIIHELAYNMESIESPEVIIAFFHDFLNNHPYSHQAWFYLGQTYLENGYAEKSVQAFEYCLAIDEDFKPALHCVGQAQFALGNYDKAAEALEECIVNGQSETMLQCQLGECYEQLDEMEKALTCYDIALEGDKEWVAAWVGKAVANDNLGNDAVALECISKAYNLEPDNEDVGLLCAEQCARQGNSSRAIAIYKHILDRSGVCVEAWLDLTDVLLRTSGTNEALEALDLGLSENPEHTSLLYRKVAYIYLAKKRSEALLLLRQLFQSQPAGITELMDYLPQIIMESEVSEMLHSSGDQA